MNVTWTKKFNANICQLGKIRSDEKKILSDLPKKISIRDIKIVFKMQFVKNL